MNFKTHYLIQNLFFKQKINYKLGYSILTYNILTHSIYILRLKGILGSVDLILNFIFFCNFEFNVLLTTSYNHFFSKNRAICIDSIFFFFLKKTYLFLKKRLVYFFFFSINLLKNNLYSLNIGLFDNIEIKGYTRRLWFDILKKKIYLKVGRSFINLMYIPKLIFINLIRKRFLFFFSLNSKLIKDFGLFLYNLQPADNYKGEGVILKSRKIVLKDRFLRK